MEKDNNIKNYTGVDIEKYHRGNLSAKERHALEKAALDDPFLSEALEGYAVAGVDAAKDMSDLRNRLAEKVEAGKTIPIAGAGKSSIPWLRVAALVVIIAGAGLLANQFIFRKNSKDMAQAETLKKEELRPTENRTAGTVSQEKDSAGSTEFRISTNSDQNNKLNLIATGENSLAGKSVKDEGTNEKPATSEVTILNDATTTEAAPALKNDANGKGLVTITDAEPAKKEMAGEDMKKMKEADALAKTDKVKPGVLTANSEEAGQKNRAVSASRKMTEKKEPNYKSIHTFRGRVTDENNVGLPFARVYNPNDNNAGTYTDVSGNFNLTFPDSVLTVQVKSIGFENTNALLRNNIPDNQVILKDDRTVSEVVISNQKPNVAARNRDANRILEEPEPADGWDKYDTYLANNLNAPDEIKTKPSRGGEVQVSFEVDKNGEPIGIKIEKSLCDKCDKEAIRLIKEGPKWRRLTKKSRTTVTISFDHPL